MNRHEVHEIPCETHRVTLELTGRFDRPPSEWPWEAIFGGHCRMRMESGDSVRVVKEPADDAARWRRLVVGDVTQEGDEWLIGEIDGVPQWRRCAYGGTMILPNTSTVRRRRVPLPDHRDLPQAVAELRERVARLEQYTEHGSPLATVRLCLGCGRAVLGGPTRCARCANASTEKREAAPGSREGVSADGLRTEPVTLRERTPGEAAAYAEGMTATVLTDLIRARNDAREECERLRARVAELEAAAKLAPAANAGGEKPPPPRGWLTSEERDAVRYFSRHCDENVVPEEWNEMAIALRAILARETQPKVRVPEIWPTCTVDNRDRQWRAAIRAAGGEVE